MMKLNWINNRATAAEIFSSSICNMDCNYCYIYKNKELSDVQKKINNSIDAEEYIEILYDVYDDNLQYLGFWGAEPTISLDKIEDKLDVLFDKFNKLKSISFSSNFLENTNKIISFATKLNEISSNIEDREIEFDVQISLDGPHDITDRNRQKNSTDKIIDNFKYFLNEINKIKLKNLKITAHFKPTVSLDNIRDYIEVYDIIDYFNFFDSIFDYYEENKLNECGDTNVDIIGLALPTLVVPGEYTSSDGKDLKLFFENLFKVARLNIKKGIFNNYCGSLNNYYYRLLRRLIYLDTIPKNNSMLTCSGGDSNYGIDYNGGVHICHRSFSNVDEDYINSLPPDLKPSKIINNASIKNINNNKDVLKWQYSLRGYHDFIKLRISYISAMVKELALSNQADKIYLKNDELLTLFSLFITSAFSCPMDSLEYTTTYHFTPISVIRLFANGAFQQLLKEVRYFNYGGEF